MSLKQTEHREKSMVLNYPWYLEALIHYFGELCLLHFLNVRATT